MGNFLHEKSSFGMIRWIFNNIRAVLEDFRASHCLRSEKNSILKFFFHFLPNKMCNSGATRLKCYWSNGMKIMKFIHCYWTQWCSTFISWVLLAPSSVEIFNFWTRRAWRLKFSQNDAHVILHHSYLLRFFVCALFLHLDPLKRP